MPIQSYRDLLVWQKTQLLIVDRLKFLPTEEIEPALSLSSEVGKMLNGLMNKVGGGTR